MYYEIQIIMDNIDIILIIIVNYNKSMIFSNYNLL